jgi:hypothetical protein
MVNEALRAAPGPSPLPNSPRPSDFGDIVKKETTFKVNEVLKKNILADYRRISSNT